MFFGSFGPVLNGAIVPPFGHHGRRGARRPVATGLKHEGLAGQAACGSTRPCPLQTPQSSRETLRQADKRKEAVPSSR